jgi:hypothetical protein
MALLSSGQAWMFTTLQNRGGSAVVAFASSMNPLIATFEYGRESEPARSCGIGARKMKNLSTT